MKIAKKLHSRRQIERIFARAHIGERDLKQVVDRYMGDSPVPPIWSAASVNGVFGKRIYRLWSRKVKNRQHSGYRSERCGRWLYSVVQTVHDLEPHLLDEAKKIYSPQVINV